MIEHSEASRPTDFELTRARPLRAGSATQSVAPCEPRKRRANERPRVGCCEELARPCTYRSCRTGRSVQLKITKFAGVVASLDETQSEPLLCAQNHVHL